MRSGLRNASRFQLLQTCGRKRLLVKHC
jgi:hypothetical protein